MRRVIAAVAWALAVAGVGCGGPVPCPTTVRAPAQGEGPLLWRVQAADGSGPVLWLYGTIHDAGAGDVAPAAWAALAGAPRFVSELGDLELDAELFRDEVRLPRGKGLDQLLPLDDWWALRDVLRGTIKEADLARVRPWYAMTLLTRKVTDKAHPGMDVLLRDRARAPTGCRSSTSRPGRSSSRSSPARSGSRTCRRRSTRGGRCAASS